MKNKCVCCGAIVPEGKTVCTVCERDPDYAVQKIHKADKISDYKFSVVPKSQHDLFFSGAHDKERGCIGHLRGDFGAEGNEFWTSWWPHCVLFKTKTFSDEFDSFINSLRKNGPLKNRAAMAAFCNKHPEAEINSWTGNTYGFKFEAEHFVFYLRCFPCAGDYNFYCYCYDISKLMIWITNK